MEVDELLRDLYDYIGRQDHLVKEENVTPLRTHALERVFNRAFTQVLFGAREEMLPIDLFLCISQEPNSHAAYFLLKWGVNRKALVDFFTHEHPERLSKPTKKDTGNNKKDYADKILAEYCTDLNQHVKDGKIDPVIGRLGELVLETLAETNGHITVGFAAFELFKDERRTGFQGEGGLFFFDEVVTQ